MVKMTGTSNAANGNFKQLLEKHHRHDDLEKNDHVKEEHVHLNEHVVLLSDAEYDDFYEREYTEKIKEHNKGKRKDRRLPDDYDEYVMQRKMNLKRKDSKTPYGNNRQMLFTFGNEKDNEEYLEYLESRGFTRAEALKVMGDGLKNFCKSFNDRYSGSEEGFMIREAYTHVDEASPQIHTDMYCFGSDKKGKPYTDYNQVLKKIYGDTVSTYEFKDGLDTPVEVEKTMTNRDLWSRFRDDIDVMMFDHVVAELDARAQEKGVEIDLPEFVRLDSEKTGVSHETYKAQKQLEDDRAKLNDRQRELEAREHDVDKRENEFKTREMILKRDEGALTTRETLLKHNEDALETRRKAFEHQMEQERLELERQRRRDIEIAETMVDEYFDNRLDNNSERSDLVKSYLNRNKSLLNDIYATAREASKEEARQRIRAMREKEAAQKRDKGRSRGFGFER